MNVDMLKMLYVNSTYNNSSTLNKSTTSLEGENSFISILNEVISGDSLNTSNNNILNSILETTEEESKNNDLLTSLMLLMQQGFTLQDNYVDYENILNSLKGSDNLSTDALNSVIQNIQLTNNLNYQGLEGIKGLESLEGLILGQQNLNTQTNTEHLSLDTTTIEGSNTSRVFPKEIMESINSLRQARDNIRLGISQVTNNGNVDSNETNIINQNLTSTNLEKISLNNMNVDGSGLNNNDANSIINLNNISDNKNDKAVTDFNLQTILNTEAIKVDSLDSTIDEIKDIKVDDISEGLLSANRVNIQNDNKIIKISDESSVLKESVITQVKDQIVLMKAEGKQTVTMQLTPENLGKLDIKMVFENGNLSIEILTSNPKTHSIILSNISELKSILQNSFADKTFMNMEAQKQPFEQNNNQNNQGYNQQHSHQENKDRREPEYEPAYSEGLDDNSIDFYTELSKIREYRYNTLSKI